MNAKVTCHKDEKGKDKEVSIRERTGDKRKLCFQEVTYHYDDKTTQDGFRFIWRRKGDKLLQPARGQARIPNAATLKELIKKAKKAGFKGF